MYSRNYSGQTLNFEPSGGLINGSLVMVDKETDTYWAIMKGEAIGGRHTGMKLNELPVGEKMPWSDWVTLHPDTLVLSVRGVEDLGRNAYEDYFTSSRGFRGLKAKDKRLETKQPIYSFRDDQTPYAVPHSAYEGGAVFELGEDRVFLYRPAGAAVFHSTAAFRTSKGTFQKVGQRWLHTASGREFDPNAVSFYQRSDDGIEAMTGFDTYWYNWSLANPDTKVLKARDATSR